MAKSTKPKTTKEKPKSVFRTPVVAVMGHVDHGKTSLLDALRGANVAAGEDGGITQNTRAHQIQTKAGNKITFIDTPGHEAFSAMRARGAEVTDFVMLVVAADDGVQAQTKESIKFAKETNTPIIVAINKGDMPGANPEKVKRELSSFGVNVEEYGGESMCFVVSAIKKTGLEDLIEGIELLSEVSELKTAPIAASSLASAYVLEASADKRLGPVALCILKSGQIKGRVLGVHGREVFRVRACLDQWQKPTSTVSESDPFWLTGANKVMETGATVYFAEDEKAARQLISESEIAAPLSPTAPATALDAASAGNQMLMDLLVQRAAEAEGVEQKILNILVKASTKGTLEAVEHELKKLGNDERVINIILSATGEVSESDIRLAKAAKGIIVSFQLPSSSNVERYAKQEKVVVRNYQIIYEMMDELSSALDGLIEPEQQEVEIARARIKQIFKLSDGTIVMGSEVTKGTLLKGYPVYVERPRESTADAVAEVARGKIRNLRILKDEVREVKKGQQCGIMIDADVSTVEEGDEVVAYKLE